MVNFDDDDDDDVTLGNNPYQFQIPKFSYVASSIRYFWTAFSQEILLFMSKKARFGPEVKSQCCVHWGNPELEQFFARVILSSQACSILCCALTWLRQLVVKLSRGRTPYCQNWRIMVRWSCSLPLYLSVCPSIFLSVCLSVWLSVRSTVNLCLSVFVFVCPSNL